MGGTGEAMAVLVYEWRSLSAEGQAYILGLRDIYEQMWLDVLGEARLAGYCQGDPFILRRFLTGAAAHQLRGRGAGVAPEGRGAADAYGLLHCS